MKAVLVLALLLAAGSAIPKTNDAPALLREQDITLSDRVHAACEAEGGCTLFTKAGYDAHIEAACAAGYRAGLQAQRGAL